MIRTIGCPLLLSGLLMSQLVAGDQAKDGEALVRSLFLEAQNTLATERPHAATLIPISLLEPLVGDQQNIPLLTKLDQEVLANQWLDTDYDGEADALLVIANYPGNASRRIEVIRPTHAQLAPQYPALTQAEMGLRLGGVANPDGVYSGGAYHPVQQITLPAGHAIGDKLFKYEGFGWESDRIAYRFYFDQRGLIDIFGKRTPELVLGQVGLDGTDYHIMNNWGMDVLKVGPSLGLGGVAAWRDGKIQPPAPLTQQVELVSGPLASSAHLTQTGWKLGKSTLSMVRHFSIQAHSYLTHTQVASNKALGELAVGIVRHDVNKLQYLKPDSEWNYLATFGNQSLAGDRLGMMVFFRHTDLRQIARDELNELVILKMSKRQDFYVGARWEGESSQGLSEPEFIEFLERTRKELNSPIKIRPLE